MNPNLLHHVMLSRAQSQQKILGKHTHTHTHIIKKNWKEKIHSTKRKNYKKEHKH